MGLIQFGVSECVEAISARARALGGTVCKQRKPQPVHIAQTGTHTQIWGGLLSCVGWFFHFFSLPVCLSLAFSLSLSASPCLRKLICFKTRAKYYHIYIFLFQEGSRGGVCAVDFSFFLAVERSRLGVRLCLKL